MGQAQSHENSIPTKTTVTPPPPSTNSDGDDNSSSPMGSLLAGSVFNLKSLDREGSDCVHPFVALQSCIKANPDAFSKAVSEDEEEKTEKKEEQPSVQDHGIIPPRSGKSKL